MSRKKDRRQKPRNGKQAEFQKRPDEAGKRQPGSEKKNYQEREVELPGKPVLRFSPTAWAKLVYFRDRGNTEIGGLGITPADDLLFVQDFVTVEQEVGMASVCFDDEAVADFFEDQVDQGRKPEQFARIWLHTHPGFSPKPSSIDEETFHRVFGSCQWAVMFVLGKKKAYARLRFNVGPGGEVEIPVRVDFFRDFEASDHEAWEAEYQANIKHEESRGLGAWYEDWDDLSSAGHQVPQDWQEELAAMEPEERQYVLQELGMEPEEEDEETEEVDL